MHRYVIKRVFMLIPVIIGVSFLIFVMMDLAPGNVLDMVGGELSDEQLAQLTRELGLDRSVFYRYILYMKGLLSGDLGHSFLYKTEVWELYMQRFPATLKLAGASILVCIVLAIPLGVHAATKHGTITDNLCTLLALLGLSMPNFWLGLMLIVFFSQTLGWLPSSGDDMGVWSLILPAITVGTGLMATLARTTRSSMLDVLRQDYLRTVRSVGMPERTVISKHALRNALIPIITIIGTQLGGALGGAVVTENVFAWPGVGRLIIDAIRSRDTTVVTGCIIMSVILISVIQLLVDLLYAYVDPRLRAEYSAPRKKTR